MWNDLSKAEQDAVEEALRVASRPGQHEEAAKRLHRAFPGVSEAIALKALMECMEQVPPPRDREAFAACLVGKFRE